MPLHRHVSVVIGHILGITCPQLDCLPVGMSANAQ